MCVKMVLRCTRINLHCAHVSWFFDVVFLFGVFIFPVILTDMMLDNATISPFSYVQAHQYCVLSAPECE